MKFILLVVIFVVIWRWTCGVPLLCSENGCLPDEETSHTHHCSDHEHNHDVKEPPRAKRDIFKTIGDSVKNASDYVGKKIHIIRKRHAGAEESNNNNTEQLKMNIDLDLHIVNVNITDTGETVKVKRGIQEKEPKDEEDTAKIKHTLIAALISKEDANESYTNKTIKPETKPTAMVLDEPRKIDIIKEKPGNDSSDLQNNELANRPKRTAADIIGNPTVGNHTIVKEDVKTIKVTAADKYGNYSVENTGIEVKVKRIKRTVGNHTGVDENVNIFENHTEVEEDVKRIKRTPPDMSNYTIENHKEVEEDVIRINKTVAEKIDNIAGEPKYYFITNDTSINTTVVKKVQSNYTVENQTGLKEGVKSASRLSRCTTNPTGADKSQDRQSSEPVNCKNFSDKMDLSEINSIRTKRAAYNNDTSDGRYILVHDVPPYRKKRQTSNEYDSMLDSYAKPPSGTQHARNITIIIQNLESENASRIRRDAENHTALNHTMFLTEEAGDEIDDTRVKREAKKEATKPSENGTTTTSNTKIIHRHHGQGAIVKRQVFNSEETPNEIRGGRDAENHTALNQTMFLTEEAGDETDDTRVKREAKKEATKPSENGTTTTSNTKIIHHHHGQGAIVKREVFNSEETPNQIRGGRDAENHTALNQTMFLTEEAGDETDDTRVKREAKKEATKPSENGTTTTSNTKIIHHHHGQGAIVKRQVFNSEETPNEIRVGRDAENYTALNQTMFLTEEAGDETDDTRVKREAKKEATKPSENGTTTTSNTKIIHHHHGQGAIVKRQVFNSEETPNQIRGGRDAENHTALNQTMFLTEEAGDETDDTRVKREAKKEATKPSENGTTTTSNTKIIHHHHGQGAIVKRQVFNSEETPNQIRGGRDAENHTALNQTMFLTEEAGDETDDTRVKREAKKEATKPSENGTTTTSNTKIIHHHHGQGAIVKRQVFNSEETPNEIRVGRDAENYTALNQTMFLTEEAGDETDDTRVKREAKKEATKPSENGTTTTSNTKIIHHHHGQGAIVKRQVFNSEETPNEIRGGRDAENHTALNQTMFLTEEAGDETDDTRVKREAKKEATKPSENGTTTTSNTKINHHHHGQGAIVKRQVFNSEETPNEIRVGRDAENHTALNHTMFLTEEAGDETDDTRVKREAKKEATKPSENGTTTTSNTKIIHHHHGQGAIVKRQVFNSEETPNEIRVGRDTENHTAQNHTMFLTEEAGDETDDTRVKREAKKEATKPSENGTTTTSNTKIIHHHHGQGAIVKRQVFNSEETPKGIRGGRDAENQTTANHTIPLGKKAGDKNIKREAEKEATKLSESGPTIKNASKIPQHDHGYQKRVKREAFVSKLIQHYQEDLAQSDIRTIRDIQNSQGKDASTSTTTTEPSETSSQSIQRKPDSHVMKIKPPREKTISELKDKYQDKLSEVPKLNENPSVKNVGRKLLAVVKDNIDEDFEGTISEENYEPLNILKPEFKTKVKSLNEPNSNIVVDALKEHFKVSEESKYKDHVRCACSMFFDEPHDKKNPVFPECFLEYVPGMDKAAKHDLCLRVCSETSRIYFQLSHVVLCRRIKDFHHQLEAVMPIYHAPNEDDGSETIFCQVHLLSEAEPQLQYIVSWLNIILLDITICLSGLGIVCLYLICSQEDEQNQQVVQTSVIL